MPRGNMVYYNIIHYLILQYTTKSAIHQGISQPINESSTNGAKIGQRTGRPYECMCEWIDLSITQPINRGTNGPIGGPFTEAPIESPDEWADEWCRQRGAIIILWGVLLYCAVLYCMVSYCIILYYIVLWCCALYYNDIIL